MRAVPISSKAALARFSRASSGATSTATRDTLSQPISNIILDGATISASSSDTGIDGSSLAGRSLSIAPSGSLLSIGTSNSILAMKDQQKIMSQNQRQRQFLPSNNILRILEGTQSLQPTTDHFNCCGNEATFNCAHSGTCSECSESTLSSLDESKNAPGFGWAKKPKTKSNLQIIKAEAKKEKSAEGLKDYVYNLSFMDFFDLQKKGCNDRCKHGQECLKKVSIEYVGQLREKFWGKRNDAPFKPAQRKTKIQDIFITANSVNSAGVSFFSFS